MVGASNGTTGSTLGKLVGRRVNGLGEEGLALEGGREESYVTWNDSPDSERTYFDTLTRGARTGEGVNWRGDGILTRE